MNKEKKLSKKLSTHKMHLKRGKIKLYTKLSTLSTFFYVKKVVYIVKKSNIRFVHM